ncbi:erythromycin esterase family protein [Flavobacterium psychrophilum]
MKCFIVYLLLFSSYAFSQSIKGSAYPINSNSNYYFLDNVLKGKKIVLLGEQSHGDGATFDEKVILIKYLHEKLGFNTIAFESGFYDNYKAFKDFSTKKEKISIFNESVFSLWSDTKSFQGLLNYIEERAKQKDTIKIVGFDSQDSSLFNNNFIEDLKQIIRKRKLNISENAITKIEKIFVSRDFESIANSKIDSLDLVDNYHLILNLFKSIKNMSLDEKMMQQVFKSKMSDVDFSIKLLQNQQIAVQNPRDEQMSKNLIFLSELNPSEKIICWGASYHFARNLNQYKYTDVTENYFNQQAALEKKITGQTDYKFGDGKEILKDALPMGQILKNYFKDFLYSLAFSSYEGEYGMVNDKKFPILTPPKLSVEKQLYNTKNEKVFFNYNSETQDAFYSSALGNLPMKAKWNAIFDGLIFIKTSYQPEFRTYEKSVFFNSETTNFKISVKISDSKTNRALPNAEIVISSINKTFNANKFGEFNFDISKNNFSGTILISSQGYLTDTISISKLMNANRNVLKVRLKPYSFSGYLLKEVVLNVNNKQLSAEEIIEKAQKNIKINYYQNPFNQIFYFKSELLKDGEKKINDEAYIKTYNSKGMYGSNTPYINMYGQIEQLKNSKNKSSEYFYTGREIFWSIFCRDLLLSKSNILYKTDSFSLKKEGKMEYQNRTVYKISFINNSPGSYSTGYGYPAPKFSSGFLYIDSDNFAILRYEHCVEREPFTYKNSTKTILTRTHKIIETYKNVNGYYFIDQLTVFTKNRYSSNVDNYVEGKEFYDINIIKSTEVDAANLEVISVPIDKIDDTKSYTENTEFWKNNTIILDNCKYEFDACR